MALIISHYLFIFCFLLDGAAPRFTTWLLAFLHPYTLIQWSSLNGNVQKSSKMQFSNLSLLIYLLWQTIQTSVRLSKPQILITFTLLATKWFLSWISLKVHPPPPHTLIYLDFKKPKNRSCAVQWRKYIPIFLLYCINSLENSAGLFFIRVKFPGAAQPIRSQQDKRAGRIRKGWKL